MITTLDRLRMVWFVDSAITIWRAGDRWIDSLVTTADALAAVRPVAPPPSDTTAALMARVHAINDHLTRLEFAFSAVLGEGARWTQRWLARGALALGVLLVGLAGAVAVGTLRRLRHGPRPRSSSWWNRRRSESSGSRPMAGY